MTGGQGRSAVGEARATHDLDRPDLETASDGYAARFAGPLGDFLLQRQMSGIEELARPWLGAGRRILEVGAGHAQATAGLMRTGAWAVCHGSSFESLARPRQVGRAVGLADPACVASSLWRLPFADRSFDLVVGLRLLPHVQRWQALLDEMVRVAKGAIVVDFPPAGGVQRFAPATFGLKQKVEKNTRPFFAYDPAEVRGHLSDRGLDDQALLRQFFMPLAIHRALGVVRHSRRLEGAAEALGLTRRYGAPVLLRAARI